MLATLSKIFSLPKVRKINFVSRIHMTAYQRQTWLSSSPMTLTEERFDELAVFMATNFQGRWSVSFVAGIEGTFQEILLERESEWCVLEHYLTMRGFI